MHVRKHNAFHNIIPYIVDIIPKSQSIVTRVPIEVILDLDEIRDYFSSNCFSHIIREVNDVPIDRLITGIISDKELFDYLYWVYISGKQNKN